MVPHCFILGFKLFSLCFKKESVKSCCSTRQNTMNVSSWFPGMSESSLQNVKHLVNTHLLSFTKSSSQRSSQSCPVKSHPRPSSVTNTTIWAICQPHQYTGSIWEKETFPHREAYLSLFRTGRIWCILVLGEFLYAFDFIVSITPSKWPLVTWTTRVTQASLCFHYLLRQVMS